MEYDPELFGKALPCLTSIACALPPDYAKSDAAEEDMFAKVRQQDLISKLSFMM